MTQRGSPAFGAFSGKVGTGFPVRKCDNVEILSAFSFLGN
jgi:hypothetical protein